MPSLIGTAASQVGSFARFVPHFVKVETLLNLC
jgi:hypothetical protein